MAQKPYLPYPVTTDWCERVHDALGKMPRGTQSRLAEYLRVSTGHLADVLKGKYDTSDLVEPIHRFLGWSLPLPPTAALDAGELLHGYIRMTKKQREFLDQARAQLEGASGEQAKLLLEQMLKTFHTTNDNEPSD